MNPLILAVLLSGISHLPFGSPLEALQRDQPNGTIRPHGDGTKDYLVVTRVAGRMVVVTYQVDDLFGLEDTQALFVSRDSYVDLSVFFEAQPDLANGKEIFQQVGLALEDRYGLPSSVYDFQRELPGPQNIEDMNELQQTGFAKDNGLALMGVHALTISHVVCWDDGETQVFLENNPDRGTILLFHSKKIDAQKKEQL